MFHENYLTSDFRTNTVISRRVCLLVKMASKTVIRPIVIHHLVTPSKYRHGVLIVRRLFTAYYILDMRYSVCRGQECDKKDHR